MASWLKFRRLYPVVRDNATERGPHDLIKGSGLVIAVSQVSMAVQKPGVFPVV